MLEIYLKTLDMKKVNHLWFIQATNVFFSSSYHIFSILWCTDSYVYTIFSGLINPSVYFMASFHTRFPTKQIEKIQN